MRVALICAVLLLHAQFTPAAVLTSVTTHHVPVLQLFCPKHVQLYMFLQGACT